jgi:predicted XRE-type DNA-binding protein
VKIHASLANYKRGTELPHAKLTEEDIVNIRALVEHRSTLLTEARTLSNAALAEKFGVSRSTINKIAMGETWGHVA